MPRASPFEYATEESTASSEVLRHLQQNTSKRLTITTQPFPTTLAVLEAVRANTSVEELVFLAPEVLDDEGLPPSYRLALAALPNLQFLGFTGLWRDESLCLFLEELQQNRDRASADTATPTKNMEQLCNFGSISKLKITSRELLIRLTNVVQKLAFRASYLNTIETSLSQEDLKPFILALVRQAENASHPMLIPAIEDAEEEAEEGLVSLSHIRYVTGTTPTNCLEELLYNSPRLQYLRIGIMTISDLAFYYIGLLNSLKAFSPSSSRQQFTLPIRTLLLFLSEDIPVQEYQFLVEFCQQSAPALVSLDIFVYDDSTRRTPLGTKYPQIHESLQFEVSLNALGIREMIRNYRHVPKREWVKLLYEKRHKLSILYTVLREVPCLLES